MSSHTLGVASSLHALIAHHADLFQIYVSCNKRHNVSYFQLVVNIVGVRGEAAEDEDVADIEAGSGVEAVFSPSVSATCRAGVMRVVVETSGQFRGAVHARDYRRPACTNTGQGDTRTTLDINLLASTTSDNYCGVFINKVGV